MNSILLPEMSGLLEPALAVLAVIAPLGLACVLVNLSVRSTRKKRAAHGRLAPPSSPNKLR